MAKKHVSIRIDVATHRRLKALSARVNTTTADLLRTLSHSTPGSYLACHGERAIAKQSKEGQS